MEHRKKPKEKVIPVHHFRMSDTGGIPFEIVSTENMSNISRSLSWAGFPHRHKFYEILYYTGGQGTHFIDFEPYSFIPPVIYFISPGQVHFWHLKLPLEGYAILFTEDFLILSPAGKSMINDFTFFHGVNQKPELKLNDTQKYLIDLQIQTIQNEYSSSQFGRASMLAAHFHILMVQLQRIWHEYMPVENGKSHKSLLVRRFKNMVSQYFMQEQSIQYYAENLGISASHLSETVKNITGFSPGQIIRNEITMEAKRLFAHTELSAAEIGYKLSFEDPSYFGRFFKRETGMSPSVFRQQIREKYHFFQK